MIVSQSRPLSDPLFQSKKIRLPPLEVHFGVGGCGRTDSLQIFQVHSHVCRSMKNTASKVFTLLKELAQETTQG